MLINFRLLGTALLLGNLTVLSVLPHALATDDFTKSLTSIVQDAINTEGNAGNDGEHEAQTEANHQATQFSKDQADNSTETHENPKSDQATDTQTQAAKEKPSPVADVADAPVAPKGASVRIISPIDGEEVSSPVTVVFGLTGMGVAPAGVDRDNTGHHHIIIDGGDELPKAGEPMTDNVQHFGGGQTETTLELDKGEHTLQLIMGDKNHIPHNPPIVSEKITIIVK